MNYICHIVTMIGIYSILAVSLDLLAGRTGLLSIAHAAFYGIGAYTSALLAVHFHVPFVVAIVGAMAVGAAVSLLVSVPSLRLLGDYFVIATFGFGMIVFSIFNNWMDVTGGPLGIPGIPQPTILGWTIDNNAKFSFVAVIFAAFAYLAVGLIVASPFGRVLHAIREDEIFAQACGKNPLRFKVIALAVSSALAAMAGGLYAHYITYIDPTSFTIMDSILMLSMIIVGGAGSMWGPLVGAVLLVTLPEALRFLGLPTVAAANLRQVIYGVLLVVLMMTRPQGLVGRYGFGR